MNFAFSDEQELLRSTVREFLARECPMDRVRSLMEQSAHDAALWQMMAELGWSGLLIPEEHGGAGLGMVDLVPLLEETGRALVPCPLLATLQGSFAILRGASPEQQARWLPAIASGARVVSFAITESAGSEDPRDLHARAERAGDAWMLSGTKLFVPDGQSADDFLVIARTSADPVSGPVFGLFLVRREDGPIVTALEPMDRTRRVAELRLDATPAELAGAPDAGWAIWEYVRDRTLIALAADACGGTAKALDDAVRYAKQRVQFGKPIGVHQAIKHRCADMLIELESMKAMTYYAAWIADQSGEELPLMAAMAKARASDAYRRVSAENIQIHGGVGFTAEYDCHLHFKRAKSIEVSYGSATEHRERVAQLLCL
jgi:alkylation response protein AidB-like acyl-CoA dehydrogenase